MAPLVPKMAPLVASSWRSMASLWYPRRRLRSSPRESSCRASSTSTGTCLAGKRPCRPPMLPPMLAPHARCGSQWSTMFISLLGGSAPRSPHRLRTMPARCPSTRNARCHARYRPNRHLARLLTRLHRPPLAPLGATPWRGRRGKKAPHRKDRVSPSATVITPARRSRLAARRSRRCMRRAELGDACGVEGCTRKRGI